MNMNRAILLKAVESRFIAKRDEASATIEVYLSNPTGIGEHPQIVDELSKQFEELANANDVLETIKQFKKPNVIKG